MIWLMRTLGSGLLIGAGIGGMATGNSMGLGVMGAGALFAVALLIEELQAVSRGRR